jgi:hypothetical protein
MSFQVLAFTDTFYGTDFRTITEELDYIQEREFP